MTTKKKADPKRDMHADLASLAETLVSQHIEDYDDEKCFNIDSYLVDLTDRVDDLLGCAEAWGGEVGRFQLDAEDIARYLWACLSIQSEGTAWPMKFRGMPTLS